MFYAAHLHALNADPAVTAAWIAAGASALTLIVTAGMQFFGIRRVSGDTTKVAGDQLWLRREQLDRTLAEERLRTLNERFATAADRLGADRPSAVRLAAVHAMAGLADDWPENRQTCIDVLCAYLQMPYVYTPGEGVSDEKRVQFHSDQLVRHTVIRIVTAHLRDGAAVSWQGMNFDFTGVVFDGGDFRGAVFSGGRVDFSRAQFLSGVVDFREAVFSGSHVDFTAAQFSGGLAIFSKAQFSAGPVFFRLAEFSGGEVSFTSAQFSGGLIAFAIAHFSGSQVNFSHARFCGAEVLFNESVVSEGGIRFNHAQFSGGKVDFRGVEFRGEVSFHDRITYPFARLSGGRVEFDFAKFSGGTVDMRASLPMVSSLLEETPPGLILWKEHGSAKAEPDSGPSPTSSTSE